MLNFEALLKSYKRRWITFAKLKSYDTLMVGMCL